MALMSMEKLFEQVGFADYRSMEPFKFYDVSDKHKYITSYNEQTKTNEKKLVEKVVYKGEDYIYDVVLKDGTLMLRGSAGHNVFDADKNCYVALADIEEFTALDNAHNKIKCFVKKTSSKEPILDIQVKDNSNYFSNGILSHNTGGTALKFFSSTRCRVQKMEQIKNGDEVIGIQIRVRNYKNKTSVPNRDAIMNLYFDGGFKSDDEYFEFLTKLNIIEKCPGGVYKADFLPDGKIRGAANLLEWITQPEQKELYDKLKEQVTAKLLVSSELDADNVDPEKEDAAAAGVRLTAPSQTEKDEIAELAKETLEAGSTEETE